MHWNEKILIILYFPINFKKILWYWEYFFEFEKTDIYLKFLNENKIFFQLKKKKKIKIQWEFGRFSQFNVKKPNIILNFIGKFSIKNFANSVENGVEYKQFFNM